jgi:Glyoxalase-like domain
MSTTSRRKLHHWTLISLVVGLAAVAQGPQSKTTMTIKVDHASVCGSDLERLQQAFTDIDLKPDYGGPHANGITQMALVGFSDGSYLELIAPQKHGIFEGSPWAKLMAADAGPCAWAVGMSTLQQEVDRLRSLNIPVEGPSPGSRKRPDGVQIQWVTAQAGPGTAGATLPFMIEDRTPRELRVKPSNSVKDSGLTGIAMVVLAVKDMDAAVALFRKAYGWPAPQFEPHPDFGAKLAHFPGTPVILASPPPERRTWLTDRLRNHGETPVTFLIGAKNFASAEKQFHLSGTRTWFGLKVGWFDMAKLHGMRLGVIGQ